MPFLKIQIIVLNGTISRNKPHESAVKFVTNLGIRQKNCSPRSHNYFEAKANFVAQPVHYPWIVDSGAFHHITFDANSRHNVQNFEDIEDVTMGNGNVIPSTQTATTRQYASTNDFKLSTIYVLQLSSVIYFQFLIFYKTTYLNRVFSF